MKILCWNVNGIRAVLKKGLLEWLQKEAPDVVCFQETKISIDLITPEFTKVFEDLGYKTFWNSAEKKGYSGVATFCKKSPKTVTKGFSIDKFDAEGRVLATEHDDFVLFNIYFPNGKKDQMRLDYKMEFYAEILKHWEKLRKKQKNILICGDYNTAHHEIDLARPKENSKVSGFLPIEREWLDQLVTKGYVDTLRVFDQSAGRYTWWDQVTRARDRNVGWRIDYFWATQEMMVQIQKAFIQADVLGSDHCPIGVVLR
jgi:exodeoxyribonuclease-3